MENIIPFCQDGTLYGDPLVLVKLLLKTVCNYLRSLFRLGHGGTIFRGSISPLFNRDPSKASRFLSIYA